MDVFTWFQPESLSWLAAAIRNELFLAALFFTATAVLIAFCVPGILIPAAAASGAILGPIGATAAVALGALAGSQLFFVVARSIARDRLSSRLGGRLEAFRQKVTRYGLWYVMGLRLIGAPHFLVTAASALIPIRHSTFALATLLGLLPVIAIAATAGSSF